MSDGTRPPTTYGVASETSAVAPSRAGRQVSGPRRLARRPGAIVHALGGDGGVLCGSDLAELLLWPGWTFGDIPDHDRCPACQVLAG